MQTVQTSIWAVGSTSKRHGGLGKLTINRPPLITLLQIPPPTPPVHPLGCWSDGSDWSLHDLHEGVDLHLICYQNLNVYGSIIYFVCLWRFMDNGMVKDVLVLGRNSYWKAPKTLLKLISHNSNGPKLNIPQSVMFLHAHCIKRFSAPMPTHGQNPSLQN